MDEVKNPTVSIEAGSSSPEGISFTVTSTDATSVAWVVVESSEAVPTASEVLANGTAIKANEAVACKAEALKAGTEYRVVAAAQNSAAVVKADALIATQPAGGDVPGPDPDPDPETVKFSATNFYIEYAGTEYSPAHNYWVVLSDNGLTDNGGMKEHSTYYFFDLYSSVGAYYEEGVLPNGTYTLDKGTMSANTIAPEYSYHTVTTTADEAPVYSSYAEAVVVVSDNKIEATIVLEDGTRHEVTYEGSLSWGDDNGGGDTPEVPEFEATHVATKWMWSGSSSWGNRYNVSGEGFSFDIHFTQAVAQETSLAAGTYTWVSTSYFGADENFSVRNFIVDGSQKYLRDGTTGTAVVTVDGAEHHIELTINVDGGDTYMIQFDGKLNDAGSEGGEDTEAVVFTKMEYKAYNGSYGFYEYRLSNESGASMKLFVNDNQAKENFIYTGDSYDWISAEYAGNVGYFSTQSVIVDGAQVSVSKGNMVVVTDEETYHMDITITLNDIDVFKFSGKIGEDNGGGTTPSEPTKLATPSVSGLVDGNAATVSWQAITGAKDYTVTLNGTDVQTVTETYIVYRDLTYETSYSVSVVANPADATRNAASDAGTATFTTGAEGTDEGGNEGGDEGGNEGGNEGGDDTASATLKFVKDATAMYGAEYTYLCYYELTSGNDVIGFWMFNNKSDKRSLYDGTYTHASNGLNGIIYNQATKIYIEDVVINGQDIDGAQASSTMVVSNNGGKVELNLDYNAINEGVKSVAYLFEGTIE